jgi:hypothetical protein
MTAVLEAYTCIHLYPETATSTAKLNRAKMSEGIRNVQAQKTQKFVKMEEDFISRERTDRISTYLNLHS